MDRLRYYLGAWILTHSASAAVIDALGQVAPVQRMNGTRGFLRRDLHN